jgi:hypothetical protein
VQTVIDTIAGLMRKNPDDVQLYFQKSKLAVDKVSGCGPELIWLHLVVLQQARCPECLLLLPPPNFPGFIAHCTTLLSDT